MNGSIWYLIARPLDSYHQVNDQIGTALEFIATPDPYQLEEMYVNR